MKAKAAGFLLLMMIVSSFSVSISSAHAPACQETQMQLTNNDIVEMVKSGIGSELIFAKIEMSACHFDTSPPALKSLKEAGVPEAVIIAMVKCRPATTTNGATSTGEDVSKAESEPIVSHATVYVYRLKDFSTRNMHPSIWVDGIESARMDDGKYFVIKLTPGKHAIQFNDKKSSIDVDFKAGEIYYFQVRIKAGFWSAHSEVDFVQKEQGLVQIQKTKPLDAKWIKDKSRVTAEDVSIQP